MNQVKDEQIKAKLQELFNTNFDMAEISRELQRWGSDRKKILSSLGFGGQDIALLSTTGRNSGPHPLLNMLFKTLLSMKFEKVKELLKFTEGDQFSFLFDA